MAVGHPGRVADHDVRPLVRPRQPDRADEVAQDEGPDAVAARRLERSEARESLRQHVRVLRLDPLDPRQRALHLLGRSVRVQALGELTQSRIELRLVLGNASGHVERPLAWHSYNHRYKMAAVLV